MNARAILLILASASASAAACSVVQEDQIGINAPDGSEQGFGLVGDYLDHRCGSLDCHGQIGRNLRIWGCEGMRLNPGDVPFCSRSQGGKTTPDEHQATYRSLVGLEPTVMSTVESSNPPGQHPELLTFVRKARGIETHKGGQLITPGDNQDICITSWLAGQTNTMACVNAQNFPNFVVDASTE